MTRARRVADYRLSAESCAALLPKTTQKVPLVSQKTLAFRLIENCLGAFTIRLAEIRRSKSRLNRRPRV